MPVSAAITFRMAMGSGYVAVMRGTPVTPKWADGRLLQRQFARPNPVQQQILNVLEMPHPEALLGEPLPLAIPSGA